MVCVGGSEFSACRTCSVSFRRKITNAETSEPCALGFANVRWESYRLVHTGSITIQGPVTRRSLYVDPPRLSLDNRSSRSCPLDGWLAMPIKGVAMATRGAVVHYSDANKRQSTRQGG